MRQLSVYMAKNNRTKLPQQTSSTLFSFKKRSSLDVFFSDGQLEKAVRAAVPVRISGGFLSFIHKTIMEHSAAVAVVGGLNDAVEASGLSPQKLIEVRQFGIWNAVLNDQSSSGALTKPISDITCRTPQAVQRVTSVTTRRGTTTRSETRRLQSVLASFIHNVADSPLGEIELDAEPAIRDFIIDLMLKNTGLAMSMRAVLEVADLNESDLQLDVVRDNIKAVFEGKLPRRANRTLLHEAARDGAERLVQLTMVMRIKLAESNGLEGGVGGLAGRGLERTGSNLSAQARKSSVVSVSAEAVESGRVSWDGQDDEGKTALWHASAAGQDGVVEILLAAGADPGVRPKLLQPPLVVMQGGVKEVESLGGRFVSKGPEGDVTQNGGAFVIGIPHAAVGGEGFAAAHPGETCFVYEVEVESRCVGNAAHFESSKRC